MVHKSNVDYTLISAIVYALVLVHRKLYTVYGSRMTLLDTKTSGGVAHTVLLITTVRNVLLRSLTICSKF